MNARRIIFSVLNQTGVRQFLYKRKQRKLITILNLHRISREENYFWQPLSPENFEALVQYVTAHYNVIHFSDISLLHTLSDTRPPLILSFDDGYKDFIEYAIPILKKFHCKSNHNIVVDCVEHNATIWTQHLNHIFNELRFREHNETLTYEDLQLDCRGNKTNWEEQYIHLFYKMMWKRREVRDAFIAYCYNACHINPPRIHMMDWNDIKTCVANLVEIGNHTFSHDSFASEMTLSEMKHEIMESKKVIEQHTGVLCDIFSFPNGQFNSTVLKTVVEAGYKYLLFADNKFQTQTVEAATGMPDFVSRLNIVNESVPEMLLRIEGFHNKQQKRLNLYGLEP